MKSFQKKILLAWFFLLPGYSVAFDLFGPSNYEECVEQSIKSTRTAGIEDIRAACRERHPKLRHLSKGRAANLVCEDYDVKSVYKIFVAKDFTEVGESKRLKFKTVLIGRDATIFRGESVDTNTAAKIIVHGNINPASGVGQISIRYPDKSASNYSYNFVCTEVN